jgi:hypothetical protein
MSEWISIYEFLPSSKGYYLVFTNKKVRKMRYFNGNSFANGSDLATHWIEVPANPA